MLGVVSLDFSLLLIFFWSAIHPACLNEKDRKGGWVIHLINLFTVDRAGISSKCFNLLMLMISSTLMSSMNLFWEQGL